MEPFGLHASELIAMVRAAVRRAGRGVHHDLEDAAQDALYRLLTDDRVRFEPCHTVASFVSLRARWSLLDGRRRECRAGRAHARYLDEPPVHEFSPEEILLAHEEEERRSRHATALPHALAQLPPDLRNLVIGHEISGISLRTLARNAGVNVSTLTRRRQKALQHVLALYGAPRP